jgi:hypothetical protein
VAHNEFLEAVVDFEKAGGGGSRGWILDGSGGYDDRFFGGAFEDRVSGGSQGGVKGKKAHEGSVPKGVRLSREARRARFDR